MTSAQVKERESDKKMNLADLFNPNVPESESQLSQLHMALGMPS